MCYKLHNVTKKYDNYTVFEDINIELPETGLVTITGNSGSGKTTLLNILGGIDKATSGDVYFNDYNLMKVNDKVLDELRNSSISFSFQDSNLFNDLTVYENISIGLEIQGKTKKDIKENITILLEKLGIKQFINTKINKLSSQ